MRRHLCYTSRRPIANFCTIAPGIRSFSHHLSGGEHMLHFKRLPVLLLALVVLTALIAACGPAATPVPTAAPVVQTVVVPQTVVVAHTVGVHTATAVPAT